MRFNDAPTEGFHQDVGNRTTVRFTNFIYEGIRMSPDETVVAFWCKDPPCERGAFVSYGGPAFNCVEDCMLNYENAYVILWTQNERVP